MPDESGGRVYMVMEWVEGRLLREILTREAPLPVVRALRNDLKPENVMVDSRDRIKLIDIGIASRAGARRITFGKFSQRMGTPEYISPERDREGITMPGLSPRRDGVGQVVHLRADCRSAPRGGLTGVPSGSHAAWQTAHNLAWLSANDR